MGALPFFWRLLSSAVFLEAWAAIAYSVFLKHSRPAAAHTLKLKGGSNTDCCLFWRAPPQEPASASEYAAALASHPQFASLGPLFRSAEPLLLTEEETEYNIAVVVHVFPEHLLLQFNCTNTVAEQVLENVSVVVDLSEAVRGLSLPDPEHPLDPKV